MLRRATAAAVLVLLALVAGGSGAHAAVKTTSARVVECKNSDGAPRSATFLGRMRVIAGTGYMTMRFTLLEKFGDEKLHPVAFPELRAWRQSRLGVREFRYRQTVAGLQGGGEYRARIDYRWLDADGNLLRKASKITTACEQPGELPNLTVGTPTALPGPGGTTSYVVPIRNTGTAAASTVAVELSVDGAATNVAQIDQVAPGQTREVRFTGPLCKRRLRVVADPADSVKESIESDNAANFACPPLGG